MSQHVFDTTMGGKPVTVLLGWDRPLQQVFLVIDEIQDEEAQEEKIVYSNIDDQQSVGADMAYYQGKLDELGIVAPAIMFSEIELDRICNVGNRYCRYQADGSFTDSLRVQKQA